MRRALNSRIRIGGAAFWEDLVGSFPSLEAANKLVNSTIAQNKAIVEQLARGELGTLRQVAIEAWFGAPTGYQSYMPNFSGRPEIRDTQGVRVILKRNLSSSRGYSILTAFPINRPPGSVR